MYTSIERFEYELDTWYKEQTSTSQVPNSEQKENLATKQLFHVNYIDASISIHYSLPDGISPYREVTVEVKRAPKTFGERLRHFCQSNEMRMGYKYIEDSLLVMVNDTATRTLIKSPKPLDLKLDVYQKSTVSIDKLGYAVGLQTNTQDPVFEQSRCMYTVSFGANEDYVFELCREKEPDTFGLFQNGQFHLKFQQPAETDRERACHAEIEEICRSRIEGAKMTFISVSHPD